MTKSNIIRNAGIVAASGAVLAAGSVAPANAFAVAEVAPAPVQYDPYLANYDAATVAPVATTPSWNYEAAGTASLDYQTSVTGAAPWSQESTATVESTASITPQASAITDISGAREAIVAAAYDGLGGAYIWGGKSYKAWDCSGFVSYIYAQAGVDLTAYTYTMATELTPTSNPQPGDIVFTNGYAHVGIYVGNGQMISALNPTQGTMLSAVDGGGLMPVDGYYTVGI